MFWVNITQTIFSHISGVAYFHALYCKIPLIFFFLFIYEQRGKYNTI